VVTATIPVILRALWEMAELGRLRCIACRSPIDLSGLQIGMYPHKDGAPVEDDEMRFWVYYECPRCGYQNAVKRALEGELGP